MRNITNSFSSPYHFPSKTCEEMRFSISRMSINQSSSYFPIRESMSERFKAVFEIIVSEMFIDRLSSQSRASKAEKILIC